MNTTNPFIVRLVDAYNSTNLDAFNDVLADECVLVRDEEKARGREAIKGVLGKLRRAFPDIQYRVDDVVDAGNMLALRWEAVGTHRGEYLGVPATGRPISYTGITLYRLNDGRVDRIWVTADLLSLMRRMRPDVDALSGHALEEEDDNAAAEMESEVEQADDAVAEAARSSHIPG
jgi:steroid delta-isomerase-like uncharacterized protein